MCGEGGDCGAIEDEAEVAGDFGEGFGTDADHTGFRFITVI